MYCVIMAGGRGTRFWPYSRHNRPKQLLKIIGDQSMLQMTVDRLRKIKFVEDIFLVTSADLVDLIREEVKGLKPENIIIEPEGKNTAPCIGLSALHIAKLKDDAVMGIFPADHLIIGHKKFERVLKTARVIAIQNGSLVTVGIQPTYPATGYGYIQYDHKRPGKHLNAFKVKTFAEKPHLQLAQRFLQSKDFLWNGGIFIWRVDSFFHKLQQHMPELYEQLMALKPILGKNEDIYREIWSTIIPESIDYGLLEKAKDFYVVRADFIWSDLGSWNALYNVIPKNAKGNVVRGDGVVLAGKNNFIQSTGKFTAVLGLNDIVVVNTEDVTLVVPRERAEEVKVLVDLLRKQKRDSLL